MCLKLQISGALAGRILPTPSLAPMERVLPCDNAMTMQHPLSLVPNMTILHVLGPLYVEEFLANTPKGLRQKASIVLYLLYIYITVRHLE
jgi:hypothetical protein